jgi:hypothetical protein
MVGSEIINWGFQPSYKKTDNKVLLVPACMQINNGKDCKAKQKGLDITCTSCNKNCRINKLTQLGQKNNFEVFIVPHSSSFTKWLKKWENSEKIGLVAVACLLKFSPGRVRNERTQYSCPMRVYLIFVAVKSTGTKMVLKQK